MSEKAAVQEVGFAELLAALEPFADAADFYEREHQKPISGDGMWSMPRPTRCDARDAALLADNTMCLSDLTLGDLRRARAALLKARGSNAGPREGSE